MENPTTVSSRSVTTMKSMHTLSRILIVSSPYKAHTIASLRNTIPQTYVSSTQADKLWEQFQEHRKNKTCELTYGATDPIQVSQMVKHQQVTMNQEGERYISVLTCRDNIRIWISLWCIGSLNSRSRCSGLSLGYRPKSCRQDISLTDVAGSKTTTVSYSDFSLPLL